MTQVDVKASRILIVDDILDNLYILADFLEDHGHVVQMATSGKEALAVVEKTPPDLILLDIQMPGMNGYQVCEILKDNKKTRDIPVIFLSALSETSDILKGFEVGGIDYVAKPFQFREVVARVQTQLTQVQQRHEIAALREKDRQQFEKLTKARELYVAASVHDLKNPLTGIMLYGQTIRNLDADEFYKLPEIADGIEFSARKMHTLITDLLDLAQMQIGDNLDLNPENIVPILEKSYNGNKAIAKEEGVNLQVEVSDSEIIVNVDSDKLMRAFDNLISNAIKYTPAGGEIQVFAKLCETYVEIQIADTGLGIPPEAIPHLFEAFFRVKNPKHKKKPGSGLGLAIVHLIVKQHHGKIWVESELGKGSTFFIQLPLA